jgi:hypothetical protein
MLGVHDSLRVVCEHAEAAAGWGPRTSDLAFSLLRAGSRLTTVTSRSAGPRLGRPPPRADYLLFVPVSAPSLRIYHRACLGIRQSATNTLAQRNTISQPKILRGRLAVRRQSATSKGGTLGATQHNFATEDSQRSIGGRLVAFVVRFSFNPGRTASYMPCHGCTLCSCVASLSTCALTACRVRPATPCVDSFGFPRQGWQPGPNPNRPTRH